MLLLWLRILSWGYGAAVILRNFLYNKKFKRSFCYKNPKLIGVGNLSLGGTGKTPLVIYLAQLLSKQKKIIAILSRGYKRTSKGFKLIDKLSSVSTVGDEPYLLYKRFEYNPNVMVTVCENRAKGIAQIIAYRPAVEVILLDDAFQHLSITPALNILLTTFHQPFFKDFLMPLGQLREPRKGVARADMILVTKSPPNLTKVEMTAIKEKIKRYHTPIEDALLFTHIIYHGPIPMWNTKQDRLPRSILLVTGIAHPRPLRTYLESNGHTIVHLTFPDHHWFNYTDILKIIHTFNRLQDSYKAIVTTEKDSVRLIGQPWQKLLYPLPMFYIPIEIGFSQEDQAIFEAKITNTLL